MLTRMDEQDWAVVLEVFRGCLSRRGDKGRDDRRFLAAMHYFAVHNITWRALPAEFGNCDPAPDVPSLISRVRSPYAPAWGGLQRLLE
jgi:hypothetical protein